MPSRVRYAKREIRTVHSSPLFFSSSPAPGSGSLVVVPARDRNDKTDFVVLFGNLGQTLARAMAVILAVTKI